MTRNPALDVLRCIAVLLVIGRHMNYYPVWTRVGWIGVDLFFVLSGFLIAGLLFDEFISVGNIDFKRFMLRRALRIWPPLYALLAFFLIYAVLSGSGHLGGFLISAVFLSNYIHRPPTIFDHTWSLAVEEHFYVILPLILLVLLRTNRGSRRPFRSLPGIFVSFAAICLALRIFLPCLSPAGLEFGTHARIDSLFAGVTLAYAFRFAPRYFAVLGRNEFAAASIALIAPALYLPAESRFMQTIGLTLLLAGFSAIVAWSVRRSPKNGVCRSLTGGAAWIGARSYSIYLWHFPLALFLGLWFARVSLISFWLYLVLSVLVGVMAALVVEAPSIALRDRWIPRHQHVYGTEREDGHDPSGHALSPTLAPKQ